MKKNFAKNFAKYFLGQPFGKSGWLSPSFLALSWTKSEARTLRLMLRVAFSILLFFGCAAGDLQLLPSYAQAAPGSTTPLTKKAGTPLQGRTLEQMRNDLIRIDQGIEVTRKRIRDVKDARFLPDLYFTLSEFYVNKSRVMYAVKVAERKGVAIEEIDTTAEKRAKVQAIDIYQTIIDKFPKLPERDRAMFFKAHEQRELGLLDEMLITYRQLTSEYPKSQYWSESIVVIGDYLYDQKKDMELALEQYAKILQMPLGPFTPLARYKMGWCYVNLERFKDAMLAYEGVIKENTDIDLSELPEIYRKTDVRRDALMAVVRPYSELNDKELLALGDWRLDPVAYIRQLSSDRLTYEKGLQRLAKRMEIKQRYSAAVRAYLEVLRVSLDLETRMDMVERLYVAMKNTNLRAPVRGDVDEVTKTILMVRASDLRNAVKKKAVFDYEIFARDVATRSHEKAKQSSQEPDYAEAIRDYNSYLGVFPKSKYRAQMTLNLAESYFNSKSYVEAGKLYHKLAKETKDGKKKESFFESGLESLVQGLKNVEQLNRLELTEARYALRDLGGRMLALFPRHRAAAEIRFNVGQTYYDERNFDSAVKALKIFIAKHPSDGKVADAANLILDAYNQKEDYPGMIREGRWILAKIKIRDANLRANIKQIIQQAELKAVQEKAGDFSSKNYASNLMELAKKYKGSSLGDKALYEAFVALKAKRDPQMFKTGEQLIAQFGNSNYAKEVVTDMGQMSLRTADFARASFYLEIFAEKYPKNPDAKTLLKGAAQIREQTGDFRAAAKDYRAIGDQQAAARMDFLANDWSALLNSATRAGGLSGAYWQGLALFRMRGIDQARPVLEKAAGMSASSPEETEMTSHSLYLLASGSMGRFKSIRLEAGREAEIVKQKSEIFKTLTTQLETVVSSGSGRWTIAALYGLGQVNDEFANFISSAPVPAGLNSAQVQQYKNAIEGQASQYRKASGSYYSKCVSSAEKFVVFTKFVEGCRSKGQVNVSEADDSKRNFKSSGRTPANMASYRERLYQSPQDIEPLKELSAAYIGSGEYSLAYVTLSRALEVKPDDADLTARLGVVALYMNDYFEAKRQFDKAVNYSSSQPTALWGLAGLYKHFQFSSKFKQIVGKAKNSGRPKGPVHPFMQAALN